MQIERLAFNTSRLIPQIGETNDQAKDRSIDLLASYLSEQKKAGIEDRITARALVWNPHANELQHPEYGSIALRWETETDYLENTAWQRVNQWYKDELTSHLLWLSPPSAEVGYVESRYIIYERNDYGVHFRAIPGEHSPQQCLDCADNLTAFSPFELKLDSIDEIRSTPIPFAETPELDWIGILENTGIMQMEVSEAMRNGYDENIKSNSFELAGKIINANYNLILNARDSLDFVLIGAQIESQAAAMGNEVECKGSCGISSTSFVNKLLSPSGAFNMVYGMPRSGEVRSCPNPGCGASINIGSEKCTSCGLTKSAFDLKKII